jgi:hypothetical protein
VTVSDLSTYLDYGSTEISDDLNPRWTRQPGKQEPSNERKKMLTDMLATSLEYGRATARTEGLYADEYGVPREDIVPGADRWLQNESGFTYDGLIELLEVGDMQDGIDWAWSLTGAPSMQLDTVSNVAAFANPFSAVIDYGHAAWDLASGNVSGARDAWDNIGDRLVGYDPNPYGSQTANLLGVHNWQDAIWAGLDVVDIASLGFGGEIIRPIRQVMAGAARRQGRPEAARAIERRLSEEFAERAARANDAAWPGGPALYHGSGQDLSAFTGLDPAGGRSLGGRSAMGDGLYTTPDVQFASGYADAPNQEAIKHAEYFGDPRPAPVPGFVHSVKFTGEGAPRLLDYGATGVADDTKQAVLETLGQMDNLLGVPGTRLWTADEIAPLLAKLDNPRSTFADIHGFADGSVVGAPESSLRGFVEKVVRDNTAHPPAMDFRGSPGAFSGAEMDQLVSTVMDHLRIGLRDAGYHGYVAPKGGGFHTGQQGVHGEAAEPFGDAIAWFAPERDLTIMKSTRTGMPEQQGLPGTPTEDADRLVAAIAGEHSDLFEYWQHLAEVSGYADSLGPGYWAEEGGLIGVLRDRTGPAEQFYQGGFAERAAAAGEELHDVFNQIRDFATKRLDELESQIGRPKGPDPFIDRVLPEVPNAPQDWMYYTDRSGYKQYKGTSSFENPDALVPQPRMGDAGLDLSDTPEAGVYSSKELTMKELGWTEEEWEQARTVWANDPDRIEHQVAKEAERLGMELTDLFGAYEFAKESAEELAGRGLRFIEWDELDSELQDALFNIADDLKRSLGEKAEGRNLVGEVEKYLNVTGTPPRRQQGPPGIPDLFAEPSDLPPRLEPGSSYRSEFGEYPAEWDHLLTPEELQARLAAERGGYDGDGNPLWEAEAAAEGPYREEGPPDLGTPHADPDTPESAYEEEALRGEISEQTYSDFLHLEGTGDIGDMFRREIPEFTPPGQPPMGYRDILAMDDDVLLARHFGDGDAATAEWYVATLEAELVDLQSTLGGGLIKGRAKIEHRINEIYAEFEIGGFWRGHRGRTLDPGGRSSGYGERLDFTMDEIDEIVRNQGGLTDKEIRDLMGDTPNE